MFGDILSPVVPIILISEDRTWVHYCAIGSTVKEILKIYFPAYSTGKNEVIQVAGQEIAIHRSSRCFIQLEELIPEPPTTIIDCSEVAELHSSLRQPTLPAMIPEYPIQWHPSTEEKWDTIDRWPMGTGQIPGRYDFYMDGTATAGSKGAAAVIAIAYYNGTPYWIGARGVECRESTSSNRMEASAMMIALLWAHDVTSEAEAHQCQTVVGFKYDSMITGNIASGIWNPHVNLDLHQGNRALVQWLQERPGIQWIDWTHVAAHTGDAWNEAADTVAEAIASGLVRAPPMHCFTSQLGEQHVAEWLWYWERHRWGPHIRFTTTGPKMVIRHWPTDSQEKERHPIQSHLSIEETSTTFDATKEIHLKIGTANVLSLFPNRKDGQHGQGRYVSARMESLLRQFDKEEYHVIGLQETRSKLLGHQEASGYHILSHPATTQGVGGVQLWIRKRWRFEGDTLHISTENLEILHGDPQTLIVRLQKGTMKIILVTAHAPQSTDLGKYRHYWESLRHHLPQGFHTWPMILLADANARLGPTQSEGVGTISQDLENPTGEIFREWIDRHGLCLPSTWECHQGTTYTWTHANGNHQARLDYVGIPRSVLPQVIESWVDTNVDISLKRMDHEVATIKLRWPKPHQKRPAVTKPTRIPPHQFRDTLPYYIQQGYRHEVLQCFTGVEANGDTHQKAQALWHASEAIQQWYQTQPRLRRKSHMTPHTWDLVCQKRDAWSQLRYSRHQLKISIYAAVWQGWKKTIGKPNDFEASMNWHRSISVQLPGLYITYHRLQKQAVTALRDDDRAFYRHLGEQARDMEGNPGFLWKYVKPMLLKNMEAKTHNTRCRGPSMQQLHDHFDQLEAAHHTSYEQLLTSCRHKQQSNHDLQVTMLNINDLPTRTEVEILCRKVKPDKSPGVDGISGGLYKYGADLMSIPLHDIFLRAWITGAEPLQWKGGLLVPIWKRKGDSRQASTYRGITLLDNAAKRWHALLRQRFVDTIAPDRPLGQLGGFRHQQTGFASLYLRSLGAMTKQHNIPEAYLFVDLVGAFHYLVREAAFHTAPPDDDTLRHALATDQLDLEEVISQSCAPEARRQWETIPPPLQRALQDAHDHTWTSMTTQDGILARTFRGTRPGSPLADLAFNYYMGHILRDLQQCIDEDAVLHSLSAQIGIPLRAIAWVDDLVIPILAPTNEDLMQLLGQYTWLVRTVMRKHGFVVNFAKGKTEAVVTFRKSEAKWWRTEAFVHKEGTWEFTTGPDDPAIVLHIVPRYKHLGAIYGHHGDFRQELNYRLQDARKAYSGLRRIFGNPHLETKYKLRLFEALVMSKLFFNSGFWPRLRCEDATKINHQVVKWQRTLKAEHDARKTPDDVLRGRWHLLSLEARLGRNRVLAAYQVISNSLEVAWQAAAIADTQRDTWLQTVRDGLIWLQEVDEGFGPSTPLQQSPEQLMSWFQSTQHSGPRRARQLVWKYVLQESTMHEVVHIHKRLQTRFEQAGYLFTNTSNEDEPTDPAPTLQIYSCTKCPAAFPTRQACQAHQWRKHQEISIERQILTSSTCLACGKDFWTMARAQQHLSRTRGKPNSCFERLYQAMEPCRTPAQQELPSHLQGVKYLPAIQREAPVPLPSRWQRAMDEEWRQLRADWKEAALPDTLDEALYMNIQRRLDHITHGWLRANHPRDEPTGLWLECLQGQVADGHCTEPEAAWAFSMGYTALGLPLRQPGRCEGDPTT